MLTGDLTLCVVSKTALATKWQTRNVANGNITNIQQLLLLLDRLLI